MSYDLDLLHLKYGVQVASFRFATTSDLGGAIAIATTAGQAAIIHQITAVSSAWIKIKLERATSAASSYWTSFIGQSQMTEPTRILCDSASPVFLEATNIGAVASGSGFIRFYYTWQKSTGLAPGTI